jgi:hypothetical protein
MTEENRSEQVTIYVTPSTKDVIRELARESRAEPEAPDLTQSDAGRELLIHAIEELGGAPELEELIPDIELEVFRKQQEYDRAKKQGRLDDMRGGWRGRVSDRLENRLAGPEPYNPDVVEDLGDSYLEEIEIWEDDQERIEAHREWLREEIARYREAYRAKQLVGEEHFEEIDGVETGSELLELRDCFGELLSDLKVRCDGPHSSPDDILRATSKEWSVEEETLELILEQLTDERTDIRHALGHQEESILEGVDHSALREWDIEPSALPGQRGEGGIADD